MVWITYGTAKIWKQFSLIFKQRIIDKYYQRWYSEINNSPKLSSYCRFKHNFNQEQYLNVLHEKKYRIALCQFRISAHQLAVERDRYLDPKGNAKYAI